MYIDSTSESEIEDLKGVILAYEKQRFGKSAAIFSDLFRIAEQTQRDAGVRHFMGADYFQKKEKGIQGEEQRYQAVIAILDILNNSETEEEIVKKINVL